MLVSICTGVVAAWDFPVDVCEKDKRLDGVLRELASATTTTTTILEDPDKAKSEKSKPLFVRIPDDRAVDLFCADVGCYVHCADWMMTAYPSVLLGPCCDGMAWRYYATRMSAAKGDIPRNDDKMYRTADNALTAKHLTVPSQFEAMPRTMVRLHARDPGTHELRELPVQAVPVQGYPINNLGSLAGALGPTTDLFDWQWMLPVYTLGAAAFRLGIPTPRMRQVGSSLTRFAGTGCDGCCSSDALLSGGLGSTRMLKTCA